MIREANIVEWKRRLHENRCPLDWMLLLNVGRRIADHHFNNRNHRTPARLPAYNNAP